MKSLSFHGAAGTVTGSCYLLKTRDDKQILVDCGMYQGPEHIRSLNTLPLQFDPSSLDVVLLTHAHLDHCGRLPMLTKAGFKGKVFMTEPTRDMTEVILMDSARIAQKDENVPILYVEEDVIEVLDRAEIVDFGQEFEVGGCKVTYREAGHILGAASIEIFDSSAAAGKQRIVFSGDIGNYPNQMLVDPYTIAASDIVVMESTYGGRKHPQDNPFDSLQKEINTVEETGAVLMIPSFAIQRTQDLLVMIKQLKNAGRIKAQTPVFLDSPMATKVTGLYRYYGGLYNDGFQQSIRNSDPFEFSGLHILEKHKEGRVIDKTRGPRIIIAGSGMMSGGRIVQHAKKYLPRADTRILFIGYQGEETLGRDIVTGSKNVTIEDKSYPVHAHITHLQSMSGHADESQLLTWLSHMHGVRKVFLTHGEDTARQALAPKVFQQSIPDVHMPELHDEIALV